MVKLKTPIFRILRWINVHYYWFSFVVALFITGIAGYDLAAMRGWMILISIPLIALAVVNLCRGITSFRNKILRDVAQQSVTIQMTFHTPTRPPIKVILHPPQEYNLSSVTGLLLAMSMVTIARDTPGSALLTFLSTHSVPEIVVSLVSIAQFVACTIPEERWREILPSYLEHISTGSGSSTNNPDNPDNPGS